MLKCQTQKKGTYKIITKANLVSGIFKMVKCKLLSPDIFKNLKETGRKDIWYVLNDDIQYKMGVRAERLYVSPKCINVSYDH